MALRRISGLLSMVFMASCIYAGQDIRFSSGWKFYQGDASGAQATAFSDGAWTGVALPHTAHIELNYSTSSIYMGVCWYRKTFTPDQAYQGKKCFLEFEAAMQTAQVYINGALALTHMGGYTPFVLDITNSITMGTPTVIAVRLDNTPSSSFPPGNTNPDFLYFGGLYRDVTIHLTDSLHITNAMFANTPAGGGIFVTYPSVSTSSATVQVQTQVLNEYKSSQSCALSTSILNSAGLQVATLSSTQTIAAGASNTFTQSLTVTSPQLWHPDHPNLYVVRSAVSDNSRPTDTVNTTIGIRTIAFSHANGFSINNQRLVFRGANRHQAYPYIGNAAPISGQYRDALLMKQYGFNFVRMSHYVQSHGYVDACDKYGILGMACMPGWQYNPATTDFTNNCVAVVREMIRYYRNHPSIIVWETSLNEASYTDAWAQTINAAAHQEFPGSQMFTCGWQTSEFDVYDASSQGGVRTTTDTRPVICCEYADWDMGCVYATPITGCQDRVARSDGDAALLRQATNDAAQLSINRGLSWLAGDALWSAYDYQTWNMDPLTTSGVLDIFRLPKYSAWFYRSQRSPGDTMGPVKAGPMVFIASSWMSGSANPVTVFSNCDKVSLYLNNTLVATNSPASGTNLEHPLFSFSVPFQSSTLRADGLIGGVVRATYSVSTPGSANKISVAIDTANMQFVADGSDIAIVYASILDANGTVIPSANTTVTFSVSSGPGDLVGNTSVAAQAGISTVLLRSRTTGGAITVSATASGLTMGTASVTSYTSPTTGIVNLFGTRSKPGNSGISIGQAGALLHVKLPRGEAPTASGVNFTLYNAQGKLVRELALSKTDNSFRIDHLSRGVYLGRIGDKSIMFVKE
jgi:beta-galactosidase